MTSKDMAHNKLRHFSKTKLADPSLNAIKRGITDCYYYKYPAKLEKSNAKLNM